MQRLVSMAREHLHIQQPFEQFEYDVYKLAVLPHLRCRKAYLSLAVHAVCQLLHSSHPVQAVAAAAAQWWAAYGLDTTRSQPYTCHWEGTRAGNNLLSSDAVKEAAAHGCLQMKMVQLLQRSDLADCEKDLLRLKALSVDLISRPAPWHAQSQDSAALDDV